MIKTVSVLRLGNERLPLHVWTRDNAMGPTQAVIDRITKIRSGNLDADSVVSATWQDRTAAISGIADLTANHQIAFAAEVETRIYTVGGNPSNETIPADAHKVMFAYRLPDNIDPESFWHYHTEIHGPEVVEAGGDLIVGYALSRRLSTLAGTTTFFALIELWWKDEGAFAAYAKRSAYYVTRSGKAPLDDWASHNLITEFSLQLGQLEPAAD